MWGLKSGLETMYEGCLTFILLVVLAALGIGLLIGACIGHFWK